MLGESFNTLMADHMYCCHNKQKNSGNKFQRIILKTKKFSGVIIGFLKST